MSEEEARRQAEEEARQKAVQEENIREERLSEQQAKARMESDRAAFENDDIYYFVNWSDNSTENWIGPYQSGIEVIITHNWTEQGIYLIEAKVKDKYGDESNWSESLSVDIPAKSIKSIIQNMIDNICERFPILSRLLNFNSLNRN